MGHGTVALKRLTIKAIEQMNPGTQVLRAYNDIGHMKYEVRLPTGRVIEITSSGTPRDAQHAANNAARDVRHKIRGDYR